MLLDYENLEACLDLCDLRKEGEECYISCIEAYKELSSSLYKNTVMENMDQKRK